VQEICHEQTRHRFRRPVDRRDRVEVLRLGRLAHDEPSTALLALADDGKARKNDD